MTYYNELIKFLHQAKTTDLKTSTYLSNYLGVKVKVSFGQGGQANVPWISFLRDGQTTQNGIYPVYLFYKDLDLLILAYGISETKTPEVNWSLANPKTIINYFSENNLGFPFRYGKSYIFKAYKTNELAQKETLDNDLFEIVQYYKSIQLEKINQEPITKSINFSYKTFIQSIFDSNLFFVNNLIIRFTSSLLTKPFVILTGLSGSGKTKLAQAFAMWICENDAQYKIVPVGADWTNREPLLGFPNGLDATKYVTPDSGALELIINASKEENQDKPYFLILDEMNLSHVERYFADFLSVMESKEMVKLYSGAVRESSDCTKIPAEIAWPKNLFIVGTVNIDETTYMFSPKVLDRANVIEFRVTDTEMESYLASAKELKMESLKAGGASMAADFVRMAKADLIQIAEEKEINDALLAFFKELKKSGAEFGYRSASEILRFAGVAKTIEPAWIVDDVIDAAVMQKLLPKVHGSRNKLSKILPVLGGFCLVNPEKIKDDYLEKFDSVDFENDANIKYKLSFEKICRMYRNAIENGYASYAEA
jgi:5-methylcytosine-specific restriction protein B